MKNIQNIIDVIRLVTDFAFSSLLHHILFSYQVGNETFFAFISNAAWIAFHVVVFHAEAVTDITLFWLILVIELVEELNWLSNISLR